MINPDGVLNQVQGGAIQTVSRTLMEDVKWSGSKIESVDWASYPILRFPDVPRVEAVLSPYLLALQIAPKVAFAPLFVMWLGYTIYPKILVAVLIVFFPVLINVLSAMRAMDGDLINLARSFSATRLQVFRMVEYPTTLPALFSGLRIASTLAVIGVVVGELVGGNMGLGYLLVFFEGQGNTSGVFVVIAGLTVIGIVA